MSHQVNFGVFYTSCAYHRKMDLALWIYATVAIARAVMHDLQKQSQGLHCFAYAAGCEQASKKMRHPFFKVEIMDLFPKWMSFAWAGSAPIALSAARITQCSACKLAGAPLRCLAEHRRRLRELYNAVIFF
jgi:hypothetical protein